MNTLTITCTVNKSTIQFNGKTFYLSTNKFTYTVPCIEQKPTLIELIQALDRLELDNITKIEIKL